MYPECAELIHILLPYIILEVASNNYEKFNQHNSFYELVDQTKICFTENTYEECRAKTILIIEISKYISKFNEVSYQAQEFISNNVDNQDINLSGNISNPDLYEYLP